MLPKLLAEFYKLFFFTIARSQDTYRCMLKTEISVLLEPIMNVSLKSFPIAYTSLRNSVAAIPSAKEGRERMGDCQRSQRNNQKRVKIALSGRRKSWKNEPQNSLSCSNSGIGNGRRLKDIHSTRVRKNPFRSLVAGNISCRHSLETLLRGKEESPQLVLEVTPERVE